MWEKKTEIHLCLSEEYGLSCTGFTKLDTTQLFYGYSLYKILFKLN